MKLVKLEEDEVYVVHMSEDVVPCNYMMQICREWGTAMSVVQGFMDEVCSEEWEEHEIPSYDKTLKAKWTWGFNQVMIRVENVL